ncbi:MAG TPA: DNA-binding response regulator [Maribacter sp.]|uniref:response regulator transcription factor n=1 Tax=unclassified Maribacter TaxID=2615042 RepID=UPI000ECBB31C|nr:MULTISPECIES: response regulator transcription factor [unclassified Maribacter]HAF78970.1 DNA-binding response regulator [Maribacter sp.]HAI39222.1 DNA-binding response regulator [Maribacter sp.]
MSEITRIVLADDHALVRDGIRSLLETESDLQVIGEASNGKEAIDLVGEVNPDILIIDIRMPVMNGIDAVAELTQSKSSVKTIILSMHDSEEYILKSISSGANGYLLKDTDKSEFIKAIHTVREGGKYFSGDISNVLVNNLLGGKNEIVKKEETLKKTGENVFDLTNKELKVLELVLSGLTNQQISEKLQNSKRTIETHRFNLMRKMDVKNLIDLSKKSQKYNLI